MITKAEIEEMKKRKGESRGMNIKSMFDYTYDKYGEKGVKKVEKRMADWDYPIKRSTVKPMSYYPLFVNFLFVAAVQESFNLNSKQLQEMGKVMFKFNLFTKLFMKYFVSIEMMAKQLPKMFRKHYTVGRFIMYKFSVKDRYAIFRGYLKMDQRHSDIHRGYITQAAEMVLKQPVTSKQTKNIFKGDPYNEYILRWKKKNPKTKKK